MEGPGHFAMPLTRHWFDVFSEQNVAAYCVSQCCEQREVLLKNFFLGDRRHAARSYERRKVYDDIAWYS